MNTIDTNTELSDYNRLLIDLKNELSFKDLLILRYSTLISLMGPETEFISFINKHIFIKDIINMKILINDSPEDKKIKSSSLNEKDFIINNLYNKGLINIKKLELNSASNIGKDIISLLPEDYFDKI